MEYKIGSFYKFPHGRFFVVAKRTSGNFNEFKLIFQDGSSGWHDYVPSDKFITNIFEDVFQ